MFVSTKQKLQTKCPNLRFKVVSHFESCGKSPRQRGKTGATLRTSSIRTAIFLDIMTDMKDLEIIDTQAGTGREVIKGDLVICNYTGYLEDGTKFDSSFDHGRPFQFVIGSRRVIQGWDRGLMGMREGGKRTLRVPAHLAYGDRQIGAFIKPHSNLIFDVELIEVRRRDE